MLDIDKKIRQGWNLENFLIEFDCNSKEELFKILRKEFSRKTVNGYIARMEKNTGVKKPTGLITKEEVDKLFKEELIKKANADVQPVQEEKTQKEGVVVKVINFFKLLFK